MKGDGNVAKGTSHYRLPSYRSIPKNLKIRINKTKLKLLTIPAKQKNIMWILGGTGIGTFFFLYTKYQRILCIHLSVCFSVNIYIRSQVGRGDHRVRIFLFHIGPWGSRMYVKVAYMKN